MQESVVSVRGQTLIPKEVREALGIKEGSRIRWVVKESGVRIFVIPDDPVGALRGILKGHGTFQEFLDERNEERKRERELEERDLEALKEKRGRVRA
jgi:AbrB family looped-hinge helix DNA binding protein